jgi:hypothetical protein
MVAAISLTPNVSSLLLAGAAVIVVYLLLRRSRSAASVPAPARPQLRHISEDSRTAPRSEPPPDFLRWQVEMHDTARELKAELDSKLAALQSLVLIARQESERLEAAIEGAKRLSVEDRTRPAG